MSFVFSLALIAAVVTTIVLMILRFYRNLMTDEGYLMFTLPVSTTELICSQLIVRSWSFSGALAVDALGLLVTGFGRIRMRSAFSGHLHVWYAHDRRAERGVYHRVRRVRCCAASRCA